MNIPPSANSLDSATFCAIAHHLAHPNILHPLALERYGNGYALIMADVGAISLWDYWLQSKPELNFAIKPSNSQKRFTT